MHKIIIERVENGFILTDSDESTDTKIVFEFKENENQTVIELLYNIKDFFGYYGYKHDEERISITLEKQNQEE